MKTLQCSATIGLEPTTIFYDNLYNKISEILEETAKTQEYYISFVVFPTRTLYKKEWGCPSLKGEATITLECVANPEFITDLEIWKECVLNCIKNIKLAFNQSTVTCIFSECDVNYLK